jgi:hypothetical protein
LIHLRTASGGAARPTVVGLAIEKESLVKYFGALIAILVAMPSARADNYHHLHGSSCTPAYGSQSYVGSGEPGIGNYVGGAEARVFCTSPAEQSGYQTVIPTALYVTVFDGSSTIPLWCYGYATDRYVTYWSGSKYACSSSSGCPDPTSSFVGTTSMQWNLPFTYTDISGMEFGVSCNLPRSGTPYTSWMEDFTMVTSN